MISLPIDPLLPTIADALRRGENLVLEAPPGAGKTTRVPPAILDVVRGDVIVLCPRRLPARLAAHRVAEERGEALGETVGYQVRFEEVSGPRTRLRFITEGILTRRLLKDPLLAGVGAVILDEFHERHLHADLCLALLRRLQKSERKDLRLLVMSATLDGAQVARFLECQSLRSEGRMFDVAVEHAEFPDERPLEKQVTSALRKLLAEGLDGDVLVFLPGLAEIRRCGETCAEVAEAHDLVLVTLHGDLPLAEQDRAIRPATKRKVILSTNVAETSVTIEGVTAVIDSGLARVASHSPWTGVRTLRLSRVSRASAAQRAGRAGRMRPGRCVRLYTRHDHDTRAQYERPEIARLDLSEAILSLRGLGVASPMELEWLEPPPAAAVASSEALLLRLGAVDAAGKLTCVGEHMLRFPVHPRLARMIAFAEERGVAEDACALAAILSERPSLARATEPALSLDVLDALECFRDAGRVASVDRTRRQLVGMCRSRSLGAGAKGTDEAIRMAILTGFPDRVARRRRADASQLVLCSGGEVEAAVGSLGAEAQLVVVVDAEERRTGTSTPRTIARYMSPISADWLLDLFPSLLRETKEPTWNPSAERVEIVSRLLYDGLVLDETRRPPTEDERAEASQVLTAEALAAGPGVFGTQPGDEALARWSARVAFVADIYPEAAIAPPEPDVVNEAIRMACRGRVSLAELRRESLLDSLRSMLSSEHIRLIEQAAPERVTLRGGRSVRVEYERGKPPWIASRLQDFFSMDKTPSIAAGRFPLVLHLLAPNQRAVQVTTDLAGFWEKHYPSVRKELARRYPRHSWPDDPRHAAPPAKGK
ncbi:MAG: ATP-dependent helicase HrpB [Deltaproteobacteria bacterium]|nr:ATP-dependent helicase HrpB [Deltaproteobacteria bacterium]